MVSPGAVCPPPPSDVTLTADVCSGLHHAQTLTVVYGITPSPMLLVNTAAAAAQTRRTSSTRATPDHRPLDRLSRFTAVH